MHDNNRKAADYEAKLQAELAAMTPEQLQAELPKIFARAAMTISCASLLAIDIEEAAKKHPVGSQAATVAVLKAVVKFTQEVIQNTYKRNPHKAAFDVHFLQLLVEGGVMVGKIEHEPPSSGFDFGSVFGRSVGDN